VLGADPEDYNPLLTRWGHVWRFFACLLISGLAWGGVMKHQLDEHPSYFVIDLVIGLASYVVIYQRRNWPFTIALVLTVVGIVSASSSGPGALALVSLATRRKIPEVVAVGAVSIVGGQLFTYYQPSGNDDPPWVSFTFVVLITVAMIVFGMYVGSRRELLWTLRERARQAESEQELRVSQAKSAERERIAREMHDVLAHRISLVTMHAGALAYRTDLPPEQVRETAKLIQEKAHEALSDLRQVLGVLRSDSAGDRPQPTLCDLPALIEEAGGGGMVIEFASEIVEGNSPSEQIGRTVYRVVQEALTNARKHAVGTHVTVVVAGSAETGVTVTVRNGRRVGALGMPATPGAGLGLVGLRERAALAGGTLEVVDAASTFTLRCWLPWT
jgi:signal transduction histidine kinase